jgi:hypothetical protein
MTSRKTLFVVTLGLERSRSSVLAKLETGANDNGHDGWQPLIKSQRESTLQKV